MTHTREDDMAHMLNWPQEEGLLLLHPQEKFGKGDCIASPNPAM